MAGSRRFSSVRAFAAAAAFTVVVGGGWLLWRTAAGPPRFNVLLISIDTCRADHLSCYGYPQKTTPNLDALAREGVLFQNALTPVPITLPAHCSMLTGTVPPYHGVHGNSAYRLHESNVTLAETLKAHGYQTGAVVSAFILDSSAGMNQGFDWYDDNFQNPTGALGATILNFRRAEEVNQTALPWLHAPKDQPFFLFLHYYDPHFPYEPPPPFSTIFADNQYDGEIAYTDHQIGALISEMKRLDLYDSTLIIVTADHGEGLGEHGESTHGYYIYHSTTKVPLIVKRPHRNDSSVVEDNVGLIDIAPTVLSLLGIPPLDVQHGHSLTPYLEGQEPPRRERHFYTESLMATTSNCNSLLGMENQQWKYIQTTRSELYDLSVDRKEEVDVLDRHPDESRRLRNRLHAYLADNTRMTPEDSVVAVDRESRERVEDLGYVHGGSQETITFDATREDPKDFQPLFEKITHAGELMHLRAGGELPSSMENRLNVAKRLLHEVLEARPDNFNAHGMLARIARERGDLDTAAHHFQELIRIDPNSAAARHDLGHIRAAAGRWDEAIALYQEAVRLTDQQVQETDTFNQALNRMSRIDQVLYEARFSLAEALQRRGDFAPAEAQIRHVLALPHIRSEVRADAWYRLGNLMARQGRTDDAAQSFREALKLQPNHAAAQRALQGERDAATSSP